MIGLEDVLSGLGDLGDIGSDVGSGLPEGASAADMAAPGAGTDWSSLFGPVGDVAKNVGGFASDLGGFAKSVLPLVNTGLGIAGGVAGVNAAGNLADAAKQGATARTAQMGSVTQAQALAPQVIGETAGPLSGFGREELRRAEAGEVSPASRALIDNWIRGAKQLVMDRFSRFGQGDSDQLAMALAWVDQQALGLEQGMLDQMKTGGVDALGRATGAYGTAGQILTGAGATAGNAAQGSMNEQAALQALIQQMNQNVARLAGSAA